LYSNNKREAHCATRSYKQHAPHLVLKDQDLLNVKMGYLVQKSSPKLRFLGKRSPKGQWPAAWHEGQRLRTKSLKQGHGLRLGTKENALILLEAFG
jgi:hypothetical protein